MKYFNFLFRKHPDKYKTFLKLSLHFNVWSWVFGEDVHSFVGSSLGKPGPNNGKGLNRRVHPSKANEKGKPLINILNLKSSGKKSNTRLGQKILSPRTEKMRASIMSHHFGFERYRSFHQNINFRVKEASCSYKNTYGLDMSQREVGETSISEFDVKIAKSQNKDVKKNLHSNRGVYKETESSLTATPPSKFFYGKLDIALD